MNAKGSKKKLKTKVFEPGIEPGTTLVRAMLRLNFDPTKSKMIHNFSRVKLNFAQKKSKLIHNFSQIKE